MKIIYLGNNLNHEFHSPAAMALLSKKLENFGDVISGSNKKNKMHRLIDMIHILVRNRKSLDLVLIDVYSTLSFYYASILAGMSIFFSLKYILIIRGGNMITRLDNSPKLSKLIFNNSRFNIAPSLFIHDQFILNGYNINYIPNFIELGRYKFQERRVCRPKILWLRSFHEIYNPDMAIFVLADLIKLFPNAEMCMVGPDKDGSMERCKKLSDAFNIRSHITFKGLLKKDDWIKLSSNYDIFINTTDYDNMPISVIEIMALGLPIVSTNAGGLKHLHENGVDALLVDKNDKKSMINNIAHLLNNESLAYSLSLNGRKKAEKFSWPEISNSWLSILNSVK